MGIARKSVNDDDNTVRGYLEQTPDGKQVALDLNYRCKGYYDPVRDITTDSDGKLIAAGNV
jgi:hypothetical protein